MKHIYRFKDRGYVHMDTYSKDHWISGEFIANILMATFVISIAAMTAGAMVGIDITNPQSNYIQQSK